MEKRKIYTILGIIIAILVIIVGVVVIIKVVNKPTATETPEDPKPQNRVTGSFTEMSFTDKGVMVKVKSKESGHPEVESKFTASFTIETPGEGTEDYKVEYLGVEEWHNDATSLNIKINDKDFDYLVEKGESVADLYYNIPNYKDMYLHIRVTGTGKYDESGEQCKCMPIVDEKLLKTKELAGIVNFETLLTEE